MADDPDEEPTRLRRRAYSRSGTAEDLRRLAEREAVPPPASRSPDRRRRSHIPPGGLADAELRWLGAVAEREVSVARGTYEGRDDDLPDLR